MATASTFVPLAAAQTKASLAAALESMERTALLDYQAVLAAARQAERIAAEFGWIDLQARARLLCADIDRRQGDLVGATRVAKQVNLWAAESGHDYLLSASHELLAIVCRNIGDKAEALGHAVQSMAHLTDDAAAWVRVSRLNGLAVALTVNNSIIDAYRRFEEALALTIAMDDPGLSLMVLNNMAYGMYEEGNLAAASGYADRMRMIQAENKLTMFGHYLDTLARVEMAKGRYGEVVDMIQPALESERGSVFNEADAYGTCLLTMAEAQRRQGRLSCGQETLDRARRAATERGLTELLALIRREQAQVYAAAGQFERAYREHQRFHADWLALVSTEREVRARVVQAMFETEEARLASDQFRELALRDPLTGLHNRRFVDQQLPVLIERSAQSGRPLSAALLDLDYFKQVNDTLSHETGDAVLKMIADLIVAVAAPSAVVARLGGEEFVILLADTDADAARSKMEGVRHAVGHHAWGAITGRLPVSVSIGVTTALGAHTTASALLAAADRNLYAAKRAGRNRVVADPT
jgi:two-component system, cell cycle response regulator